MLIEKCVFLDIAKKINGCMCLTRKVYKSKDACRNSSRFKNRYSKEIPLFIE